MKFTESDIALVFGIQEARDMANLQWGFPVGVDHLRCILEVGLLASVHKFLHEATDRHRLLTIDVSPRL